MKVLLRQFLSLNHSWSICGQNIARSLIKRGHEVDLFSTNGASLIPEDLKSKLIGYYDENTKQVFGKIPDLEYDMQITYTALKNAQQNLSHGLKNRFLQWTYEYSGHNALPDGFAKYYKYTDHILPPSEFAKKVFIDSGIPESHMTVVPHGIDFNHVDDAIPYKLKTKKNTKILVVVAQVHCRKNLNGMLEMYGKAFTNKDDVCLVIKVQDREPKQPFELSFSKIIKAFSLEYPKHAEIEIIREFVPNIYSLYKSCDIVFSASHCEGFGITALDAHALGKINIVSNYGGFTDFSNSSNSLLIDGKEFMVPRHWLYWSCKNSTKAFMPSIDSGIAQLRTAVANKESLLTKFKSNIEMAKSKYTWDIATDQIIGLTQNV